MTRPTPRRPWRLFGLFAVAALVAFGWTQRHRFAPVEVGSLAPAYTAPALNGRPFSLAELRGKVVVLNIWATWCPPCVREMPSLQRAYEQLRADGLEVVAVSVDAPIGSFDARGHPGGDVARFVAELGLTFPILLDPKKRAEQLFAVVGLPTTIVIDRQGRIVRKVLGARDWAAADQLAELREVLGTPP